MNRKPFTIQDILNIAGDDVDSLQISFYYLGMPKEEALRVINENIEDCRRQGFSDEVNPLFDYANMLNVSMTDGEREFIQKWIEKNGESYLAELATKKLIKALTDGNKKDK